jgi:hypothetical protein
VQGRAPSLGGINAPSIYQIGPRSVWSKQLTRCSRTGGRSRYPVILIPLSQGRRFIPPESFFNGSGLNSSGHGFVLRSATIIAVGF